MNKSRRHQRRYRRTLWNIMIQYSMIRYDTIEDFNVDAKAKYSA